MAFSRPRPFSEPVSSSIHSESYIFVNKLPDRYSCLICHDLQQQPALVSCCGQHFCEGCLQQWFSQSGYRCPHCQATNPSFFVNKQQVRDINDLRVYCSNRSKGCQWVGTVGTLNGHIGDTVPQSDRGATGLHRSHTLKWGTTALRRGAQARGGLATSSQPLARLSSQLPPSRFSILNTNNQLCQYQEVSCPANNQLCQYQEVSCPKNCKKKLIRKALSAHLWQECVCRDYSCEHCGERGTYHTITGECGEFGPCWHHGDGHYSECGEFPLPCPNKCPEFIKRRELAAHCDLCPLEVVECTFSEVGCTEEMTRRDMEGHVTSSDHHHLLLTMKALVESRKEIEKLKENLPSSHSLPQHPALHQTWCPPRFNLTDGDTFLDPCIFGTIL